MKTKRFDSSKDNVWKYVFDFGDAVAEAVLYKYESFYDRTVLCISVQSGCPVGCRFCGTGKKFIRNLTTFEIIGQVAECLRDMDIENIGKYGKRFQIMFMSMGEPLLNIDEVRPAIVELNFKYPNAELLLSTMGPKNPVTFEKLCNISEYIDKVGLQFSVHETFNVRRDRLIPFKNKLNLREIRDAGLEWNRRTGRPVYINYCIGEHNQNFFAMDRLKDLFPPTIFNFTFSIICSADETMKDAGYRNHENISQIVNMFVEEGYNVRMFDPAGQDDIGGGCGQLWYVQQWMKNHNVIK